MAWPIEDCFPLLPGDLAHLVLVRPKGPAVCLEDGPDLWT